MHILLQTNDILGKGAFKTVYKGFDGLEGLGELLLSSFASMLWKCCTVVILSVLSRVSQGLRPSACRRGGMESDPHERAGLHQGGQRQALRRDQSAETAEAQEHHDLPRFLVREAGLHRELHH